jgi:hypothetical protein
MGGAIATLFNERYGEYFDGIIAFGAALHMNTEVDGAKFLHTPRTRQIFLTNVSELAVVEAYVQEVRRKQIVDNDHSSRVPVIFQLNRFGHCACYSSELSATIGKMLKWIRGDESIDADADATDYGQKPHVDPRVIWDESRNGFWCPMSVTMYYTIVCPLTEEHWQRLGVRPRTKFVCEFHSINNKTNVATVQSCEMQFEVDPFVGVAEGTLVASAGSTGRSTIRYHSTGTSLNSVAKEFGIRREGDWMFVPEIPNHRGRRRKARN